MENEKNEWKVLQECTVNNHKSAIEDLEAKLVKQSSEERTRITAIEDQNLRHQSQTQTQIQSQLAQIE